jgi:hypothetical protein
MEKIVHQNVGRSSRERSKDLPSAEELRARFIYDVRAGRLYWKKVPGVFSRAGTEAGYVSKKNGYRSIQIDGVDYREHRLIWVIWHGVTPNGIIDHINGVRDDNRIENLRDVSEGVNQQNLRSAKSNNRSTGLLGAYKSGNRIWSSIMVNGKSTFLGNFKTAEEAHAAYVEAKRKLHVGCSI